MALTAVEVLNNVNKCLAELESSTWACNRIYPRRRGKAFWIDSVCNELSIFDWWADTLSKSQLLDMKKFLQEAIKLGYTGYVCFKVGVTGCANGMWAHKKESTTGYSPDGACIYKSFTPAYNYWSICNEDNEWFPKTTDTEKFDDLKTIKQFEKYIAELTSNPEFGRIQK